MTAPRPWGELWAVLDPAGPEPKVRVELRRAPSREVDVEPEPSEDFDPRDFQDSDEGPWD